MKTLVLAVTFAVAAVSANGQVPGIPLPELTNLEEFSSRSGTLIQREFTRVGEFSNPYRVDVVKVTDLVSKQSIQGVRISANVGAGAARESAFLDSEELSNLISAIVLMKASISTTVPDTFTDLAFRSRGGIEVGAFYANRRWNIYVRIDRFDPKTSVNLDQNELDSLRDLLTQAKERIK